MKTEWDYTQRAATYDKRANYSDNAINDLLVSLKVSQNDIIADIGAGTGKLSVPLLEKGFKLICIEPNSNMRNIGIENTKKYNVEWIEGTGEKTTLRDKSVDHVFFGSSFNVLNQSKALIETNRILKNNGSFACMWNHRDLQDPTQKKIENIIKSFIVNYDYGKRRQNPKVLINESCLFKKVHNIERNFSVVMDTIDIIEAWESHETLSRQAKDDFEKIIIEIKDLLKKNKSYSIPYTTKIWYSKII